MSRNQRVVVLGLAVLVLVVAAVVIGTGGSSNSTKDAGADHGRGPGRQARRRRQGRHLQEGRHRRSDRQERHRRRGPLPRLRRPQGRRQGRRPSTSCSRPRIEGKFIVELENHKQTLANVDGRPMTSRPVRWASALASLGLMASAALPASASAHGLVGKQDLPIPRWLFAWAAAVVLVVSFVALATLWPRPRLERALERPRLARARACSRSCAARSASPPSSSRVWAGFAGTQSATANLLPTVVYVVFWVGIPFATLLLGDVFRAFNPWRAVGARGGVGFGRRAAGARRRRRWPTRGAGALAGGAGDPRLRMGRAGLRQQATTRASSRPWRWSTPPSSSSG